MALLGCSIVLAPHLWWSVHHGFPTVDYALQKSHLSRLKILKSAGGATIGALLFQVLPFAVLVVATRASAVEVLRRLRSFVSQARTAWIGVLCFGPYLLTVLCGFAGLTQISTEYYDTNLLHGAVGRTLEQPVAHDEHALLFYTSR
jgi:hypothetical protein